MRFYIIEQNALSKAGHYYSYTYCIAAAVRQLGHQVIILHNRHFHGTWPVSDAIHRDPFTLDWGQAEGLGASQWGARSISRSFEAAIRSDPPGADDHVLFHTLGFVELADLIEDFATKPDRAALPSVHMMLRYDPAPMRQAADSFRQRFRWIANSPVLSRKMRFYSDTDALARAYSRLSELPFTVLPIPFDQTFLETESRLDGEPQRPAGEEGAINFAYLGDARLEKGYDLLPDAIREVRNNPRFRERARFALQSNFNVPGGEPGIMAARDALAAMPGVELIPEALDEESFTRRLARSDVVIIPYDAAAYRARSSGILIQARAAGKPIVTTAGSWMATQVDADCAVVCEEGESLGAALLKACESFESLSRCARRHAAAARREASPERFVARILANGANGENATAGSPVTHGRRLLVIMNGDAMVLRNGASRVALAQFHYLRSAGYAVCAVFIGYNPEGFAGGLPQWKHRLLDEISRFDLEHVFVILPSRLEWPAGDHGDGSPSIEADLARHRHFDFGSDLIRFARERRFDGVLLNYVTAMPVVDALGLQGTPIVCEMHDVQSMQKAIYGHRHVHPADLEREIALLARCRHLISLNPHETTFVRDHLPDMPITTRSIFFLPRPTADEAAPAGDGTHEAGAAISKADPPRDRAAASGHRPTEPDMLFIGSNHLPNIRGLRWFLHEVFLRDLVPRGRTLVVAGSVTHGGDWPMLPGVSYLGQVDSVEPLYSAARIVILPLLEGAGGPIKTLEALHHAKPMVATSTAMRGIDEALRGGVSVGNSGPEFRDAINALLDDDDAWRKSARAAAEAALRLCSVDDYAAAMDGIFESALGAQVRY